MDNKYRQQIRDEFYNCVKRTIDRIKGTGTIRPFHQALLSEEVLLWSKFERSFSTSFGQRVIEEIAKIVAISNGASDCSRQKETIVELDSNTEEAIKMHIQDLRSGITDNRDWNKAYSSIISVVPSGRKVDIRVISDLWWKKDGIDNYMSIKTVQPNIDQTAVAKDDCLKLKVNNPNCNVYFGLPYNPFGSERKEYTFSPPYSIFDMQHDSVVLIGKDMWDTLGGAGCYEEILEIARDVGKETKELISKMV